MTATVEFIQVSKRYRLGMTRISLPMLISGWVKTTARKSKLESTNGNQFWALRDVSFEVNKGDALALVGANGAGKTTTLKLMAKITRPTSGEINVNGKLSALIELGAGFHPDLSGRENIFLNGAILGLKRTEIQRRLDSIVSFAELEKFIDTPVKRYSSGMTVRLGFAVAASIDPDILLVDEVLAVGDAAFRLKCVNRIQELVHGGTTLIFVSHSMGLVKAVCNKALYVEHGQMKHFGETSDVIEMYNQALNAKRMEEIEGERSEQIDKAGIVHITKVEVIDQVTNNSHILRSDHLSKVNIKYLAYEDIGETTLVMRIIRSDGTLCCALYSSMDQVPIFITKGEGEITIHLDPLQLYPGTYYAVATIKNKNETLSLDMVSSDWFDVKGDSIGYQDRDAVFEPNRNWKHNQEQETANSNKSEAGT